DITATRALLRQRHRILDRIVAGGGELVRLDRDLRFRDREQRVDPERAVVLPAEARGGLRGAALVVAGGAGAGADGVRRAAPDVGRLIRVDRDRLRALVVVVVAVHHEIDLVLVPDRREGRAHLLDVGVGRVGRRRPLAVVMDGDDPRTGRAVHR